MTKKEVKEKLGNICPDDVCYFYGIPVSDFNKHQLQNFVYLLISSAMAKDETKVWRDNGFTYSIRKENSDDPI